MSEHIYHFLDKNNNSVGPLTVAQISQKISYGEINENTLFWREDFTTWLEAKEIDDFSAAFLEMQERRSRAYDRDRENEAQKKKDAKMGFYGCLFGPLLLLSAALLLNKGCETIKTTIADIKIKKIKVSELSFGENWPLTVSSGEIYRIDSDYNRIAIIFIAPNGIQYGLNGTAQSMGFQNINEITKQYRDSSGTTLLYRDVGRLIAIGMDSK